MAQFDAIVIGSGVNSLVTAAILGKAGKKVLVLESRNEVGGLASTLEFAPGFKCNIIHDTLKWIDPRVMTELNLESHGLEWIIPNVVRIALGKDDKHITFHRDPKKTADSIAHLSKKDADVWEEFITYIDKSVNFLERLYQLTPPSVPNMGLSEALSMRSMLGPVFKHGSRGVVDLMRVMPMMMPELMDEWFENALLRSAVATAGIHHLSFGPFAAGTGYNLLHQHTHSGGVFHNIKFAKGGTIGLANALKTVAESYNVTIETNSQVSSIDTDNDICNGVTLVNGKSIKASITVSGLDPQNTFINLVGAPKLNPNFQTQLRNIKYRGSTARIHFALKDLPQINNISADMMKTVFSIAPTIEYQEKAADSVKYGIVANEPTVEFTIPSFINPDFAPDSKHVLSATVQYAPYHLRNQKWTNSIKEDLIKTVTQMLENYIPNFPTIIESSMAISPPDLESEFGLTEGNLNHGEMTLDQFMFMRPTISAAQYSTPIGNLYICGPGTHPGGGLHCTNGFNTAQKIIKDY